MTVSAKHTPTDSTPLPIIDEPIQLFKPYHDQQEIDAVAEVIRSGWWGQGPKTAELERRFADFVDAPLGVAVNSQTGDLFDLTCLSREDAVTITPYTVQYTRDAHGFRNPTPWPDDVDLVIVGDSFTAAEKIQSPYWHGLDPSVLNLGLPGSGSLEQLLLLRAFGLPRSPEMVIMAYFGGNDIQDTRRFARARENGETTYSLANRDRRFWDYLVTFHLALWLRDLSLSRQQQDCIYPLEDTTGTPLTFYDEFLSLTTMDAATLSDHPTFAPTRSAILQAAAETKAAGATFTLVYFPHKAQAHWPLLDEEQRAAVAERITPLVPPVEKAPLAPTISQDIDAQRDLLADLAAEEDFLFLDMTPAFRQAAASGNATYFFADTHWNQAGHDLARATLREFLANHATYD